MSFSSLREQLIAKGITTKEDFDRREKTRDSKEKGKQFYASRKKKKNALSIYPRNRLNAVVAYAKWEHEKTMHKKQTHCLFCNVELNLSLPVDIGVLETKRFSLLIQSGIVLREVDYEQYIKSVNPRRFLETISAVELKSNACIHYQHLMLDGFICWECFKHYPSKKHYPSFVPKFKRDV